MNEVPFYDWYGNPISVERWTELFKEPRHVARDEIGPWLVSTVWLGIDHNFFGGPPMIFETMVFGGPYNEEMTRYSTEEQARAGHARHVEAVRALWELDQELDEGARNE